MWGLAEIYAYRAYNDSSFLSDAQTIWEQYTPWMITKQDAAKHSHPLKNVTLPSQCNGSSIAGGVFMFHYDGTENKLSVIASTQGAYMALSAYLYELTGNQTYHDSAILSHTFIQSHLYNVSRGCIMDNFEIQQCRPDNDWASTYDTGLYLEGLSVLANTINNSTLTKIADQIAIDSMKKTSLWTNINGVITESVSNVTTDDIGHGFKVMLVRALHEHWSRSENTSEIANLIEKFLTVQHNAILNVARYPDTDWYTPTWFGPPVPTMLPWGQLAAMDVLSSAISFTANTTDTKNKSPAQKSSTSHDAPLGPIIGGAVGGSLVLILIIGVMLRRLRSRRSAAALTKTIVQKPEPLGESPRRMSSDRDPLQSIDPFPPPSPPPFPIIEHFHSSKLQNEDRQPASAATESNSQYSSSSGVGHPAMLSRTPPVENSDNGQDSMTEMRNLLNQALANLTEGAPSTAPPRYEDI
ncbi:hypothetical protein QCA50_008144 [Cerrena zonata]|uniref:Glycoside hydrolase family 76 protein n=1 Tax=Cerrena zonata TaxID=2478898 RepID=A0AAW0GGJ3_9APHY